MPGDKGEMSPAERDKEEEREVDSDQDKRQEHRGTARLGMDSWTGWQSKEPGAVKQIGTEVRLETRD